MTSRNDYRRVLPRDLFNEAKLLKCLGRLTLMIHNGLCPLQFEHDEDTCPGFLVDQNPDDGSIRCLNLRFSTAGGETVEVSSGLNSRIPYPLTFVAPDGDSEYVFDDEGELSPEFRSFCEGTES